MRFTRSGLAQIAVTAATAREMDRRTIEEYGIPGAVLMENAGSAAAEIALRMLGVGEHVVVLAGAGNNAGDGFVIARHLANAGRTVKVITAVPPENYKGDAALHCNIVSKMKLPMRTWDQCMPVDVDQEAGLVVDALLGTGLSGPLRLPFPDIIDCLNSRPFKVLAVDIPSGLDADTGEIATSAVKASATVTFALPKKGLFVGKGPERAGEVILADIGMPRDVYPPGKVPPTA
jgi:hydroxyethylthiazole kinase-like uncharacterized protein yjeF